MATENTKNEGLRSALNKLADGSVLNNIKTLAENIAIKKTEAVLLKRLADENESVLQHKLETMCAIPQEELNRQMNAYETDIKNCQTAIAAQLNHKLDYERSLNKHNFYHKTLSNKQIDIEQGKIDNDMLQQEHNIRSRSSVNDDIKQLVNENVKQQVDNELLQERIKLDKDISDGKLEMTKHNARMELLNGAEVQNRLKDIDIRTKTIEQLNILNESNDDVIKAARNHNEAQSKLHVSNIVRESVANGENIVDRLNTELSSTTERTNQLDAEIYRQLEALNQTANQENSEATSIIEYFRSIERSSGREHAAFETFKSQVELNTIEELAGSDVTTLRDLKNRFAVFLRTFHG